MTDAALENSLLAARRLSRAVSHPRNYSWAELMQRVWEVNMSWNVLGAEAE